MLATRMKMVLFLESNFSLSIWYCKEIFGLINFLNIPGTCMNNRRHLPIHASDSQPLGVDMIHVPIHFVN